MVNKPSTNHISLLTIVDQKAHLVWTLMIVDTLLIGC